MELKIDHTFNTKIVTPSMTPSQTQLFRVLLHLHEISNFSGYLSMDKAEVKEDVPVTLSYYQVTSLIGF